MTSTLSSRSSGSLLLYPQFSVAKNLSFILEKHQVLQQTSINVGFCLNLWVFSEIESRVAPIQRKYHPGTRFAWSMYFRSRCRGFGAKHGQISSNSKQITVFYKQRLWNTTTKTLKRRKAEKSKFANHYHDVNQSPKQDTRTVTGTYQNDSVKME